jgi:hypothetical protein
MLTTKTLAGERGDTMTFIDRRSDELRGLWRASAPLTAAGGLMLAAFAVTLVGLWADPRTILGAPAWLKPAKFAISIAIFSLTMAWMLTLIPEWRRVARVAGGATAAILLLEFAIISTQAWRGTTSHFNVGTPLDASLFGVMGTAILLQTFTTVAVAVATWRTRFGDRALGWALRLGLVVSIVGASTGGLMTRPTAAQLEAAAVSRPAVLGAHTVGGPDGGPGLPGTNWSTEHGDVRVAHFVGLHAMQVLPSLALWLRRRGTDDVRRVRTVWVAAASYGAIFLIVLAQALRGQSLVRPDALTIGMLAAWAVASLAAFAAAARGARVRQREQWMAI